MRFSPQMRHLGWMLARPIAHRGLHGKSHGIVENTASAFTAAMAGNYAIECDLQLTADGDAVVFHDDTLDRLTGQTGSVNELSANHLKKLPVAGSADRMQTLGELLDQVGGAVPLFIELKTRWDGNVAIAERAVKVLSSYKGPYALMSFDPDLVEAAAILNPAAARGMVADRVVDSYYRKLPLARRLSLRNLSHLERTRPHFLSFDFRELPFAPVQQIRAAGFPVITWTIRSREEESQALRYCDQVTFEGYIA